MKTLCAQMCLLLVAGSVLPVSGGSLSGTVRTPTGEPLVGAVVSVLTDDSLVSQAVTSASGTYQFTGLPDGRYRIEFFDPSGWYVREFYDDQKFFWCGTWVEIDASAAEQTADATLAYATSAPAGVTATDGVYSDRVTITWEPAPGAAYYQVCRADSEDGTALSLGAWQSGLSFLDVSGQATRTYYYFVRAAVGAHGERPSALSEGDGGWRALTAPTGVSATDGIYYGNTTVSWQTVPGATHYRVYRSEDATGAKTALCAWQTELFFKDYLGIPAQTYNYYVVAAIGADGERPSAFSTSDTGWRALAPPVGVQVTGGEHADKTVVSWQMVEGATHYRVYRSERATDPKTALGEWQTELSFSDNLGVPAKTYHYFVQAAADSTGWRPSGFSSAEAGWRALEAPQGVSATDGVFYGNTTVTWLAVPEATHYRVSRAETLDGPQVELGQWQTECVFKDYVGQPTRSYYYFVKAAAGGSGWRPSVLSGGDEGWRALIAPSGVTATDGAYYGNTTVSWQAVPGATHYRVYRSERATDPKTELGEWQTELAFKDYLGAPAKTYHYFVAAATGAESGRPSAFSSPDTGWRALAPPSGLVASGGTRNDGIALVWQPVAGATHYRICRSEQIDGPKVELGVWQGGQTFFDDSALPARTYHYFVRAAAGGRGWRPGGFSIAEAGWRALGAPQGVSATDGVFYGNTTVAWKRVPGATHYRVYRSGTPDGPREELGQWHTELVFKDYLGIPGVSYYYFVQAAADEFGGRPGPLSLAEGGWRALAAPTGVVASDGTHTNAVVVMWNSVAGATHYRVFRSERVEDQRLELGDWQTGCVFHDTNAIPARTYHYYVRAAVDAAGERQSAFSAADAGWRAAIARGVPSPTSVAAHGEMGGARTTDSISFPLEMPDGWVTATVQDMECAETIVLLDSVVAPLEAVFQGVMLGCGYRLEVSVEEQDGSAGLVVHRSRFERRHDVPADLEAVEGAVPSGLVGLPLECLALPEGDGTLDLVLCTACLDVVDFLSGVPAGGTAVFELPAWNQWHWVGGWEGDELVFSCWLRHVLEE